MPLAPVNPAGFLPGNRTVDGADMQALLGAINKVPGATFPAEITDLSTNAITAFAGGGQASATQLVSVINRVTTVATAADSVKLPTAKAGMEVTVINAAAANAMNVFPATGQVINALSANAALSVAANKAIKFICAVDGTWNSLLTA